MNTNQSTAGYGWFAGGTNAVGVVSYVDRIDFSNDSPTSASPRTNIDYRTYMGATGNANYGWFAGGYSAGTISTVARIDYSNDSPAGASPRGPLNFSLLRSAATGNSNYGWFASGRNTPLTPTAGFSLVDRIDYSNDSPTSASPRGPLSQARYGSAATGNANYGWWAGGYGTPVHSQIERIDFSNDSPAASSLRGLQPQGLGGQAATSNANYGWFGGAGLNPVGGPLSVVNRIDFSNDSPTAASPRGLLSVARGSLSAAGNANYGWFSGGGPGPNAPFISSIVDRIDYSNDSPTSASPRGPLSQARTGLGGTSNYVKPSIGQQTVSQFSNGTFGWFGGGYTTTSAVERIDFSNDLTKTSNRAPLSLARYSVAATSNANYGWFAGGDGQPTYVSTIDRIDFSNDSPASASPRSGLSGIRKGVGAMGNTNYGWFSAGATGPTLTYLSTVDRIDFANDSPAAASPRGIVSLQRAGTGGASNSNYGWIGGGYFQPPITSYSTVDRIDFSNDSPTSASPRGPLTRSRIAQAAVSNSNYGWWLGGNLAGGANYSTVDRIDFSNDSPTSASPRGPVLVSTGNRAASGNDNYGWVGGGLSLTSVERIDFANDSPTSASTRGPLTISRSGPGSTSNYVKSPIRTNITQYYKGSGTVGTQGSRIDSLSPTTAYTYTSVGTYGWFVGGGPPPIPSGQSSYSVVDRIDFSNDSPASASPRGALATIYSAGTNNTSYGWFSTTLAGAVNRIDFNNDTAAASTRGSLSNARYLLGAVSNANYGWYGGGFTPGNIMYTTVDRIDFSNDSPTTAGVRGPLSLVRQNLAAVGNASYGWFGGGYTTPGATFTSFVDRIDYSNDAASAIPRGPLSSARPWLSAVGNANYGWFAGGGTGGVSRIDRIDYSNDAASAAVRGPLSVSRTFNQGAAGNTNYGWFSGGAYFGTPSPTQYSTVNRIDFSNDSPTAASPRGPLSLARSNVGAASNYVK